MARPWDHPRVCGEHFWMTHGYGEAMGSSPRMRGTHNQGNRRSRSGGIIPAYAGNTAIDKAAADFWRDHPRVCGEHAAVGMFNMVCLGSSPRMRGTPHASIIANYVVRIIPAYAGNTKSLTVRRCAAGDHPRVCGEHYNKKSGGMEATGSSPRMLGTRNARHGRHRQTGIIPAYAGNTFPASVTASRIWDHPRVCGEHSFRAIEQDKPSGSSPRMRGTRSGRCSNSQRGGIIPAYAGNTTKRI